MRYSYICVILLVIIIIVFNALTKSSYTNGFQNYYGNKKWDPKLINRFMYYQTTVNNNVIKYNLDILQQQATPEEAEHLLSTGFWPWTDELKNLYIEHIWSNPMLKIDPHIALNNAMKQYYENAARQLLMWNTKEGQLLLFGVSTDDGFVDDVTSKKTHSVIKCSDDKHSVMQKKTYTGLNFLSDYKLTNIEPADIPSEIPGFTFTNGICNPCSIFDENNHSICPFEFKTN